MTKDKEQQLELLEGYTAPSIVNIFCEECQVKAESGSDDPIEYFYMRGWRVINDRPLCPKCAKK